MRAEKTGLSILLFMGIALLYSWPFFFIIDAWWVPKAFSLRQYGEGWLVALFGHLPAMLGPGIAALILWKKRHWESLPEWKWSHFRYYVWIAVSMIALWGLPGIIGLLTIEKYQILNPIEPWAWAVVIGSLTLGWIAGMGEELGWTAYLLPRLAPRIGKSRALVVSGALRGIWHYPVLAGALIVKLVDGETTFLMFGLKSLVLLFQLIVSNAVFGSVFGWLWYQTRSIPLLGWFHQWFDAARDISALLIIGYAGSLWVTVLWAIPFYLVAAIILTRVAQQEGANLWTLAPPESVE